MSGKTDRSIMEADQGQPRPLSAPGALFRGHVEVIGQDEARDTSYAVVECRCGHVVFDGEAIRSRCVKPAEGVALCRCKRWVEVPIAVG